ncbi:MAG: hypothetical protein HC850_01340 [Rhodomicrobium sp.]|nr:hypothetical protein [Rhodomicrobium sp.]
MIAPPSTQEIGQLSQALLLGTRKRPVHLTHAAAALLPGSNPPAPTILGLVLAGQHARFERPAAPPFTALSEADLAMYADPRPMLSEHSRRLLKQLIGMAKGADPDVFPTACRDRAGTRGLRLHPFDLPALAPLLRNAETSGRRRIMPMPRLTPRAGKPCRRMCAPTRCAASARRRPMPPAPCWRRLSAPRRPSIVPPFSKSWLSI